MTTRELLYTELDCPRCPHSYGVSPCTASGEAQCKNTAATCQDLPNYGPSEVQTIRWVKSASYIPPSPYAVPSLQSVTISSQRINPGENLGKRERVTAAYFNHRHNDSDLDPYVEDRPYNPYEQGTYWGKFAAMYPNIQGFPYRVIRGNEDQEYSEMEVSHYVADVGKIAGDKKGYSISAKDVLDFAEGNKTLCPSPSQGLLAADITSASGSVTLTPSGIGATYPAFFDASIGDEAIVCSRSGDVVTFIERGAFFTDPDDHEEGDTLQIMETFISQNASQILERLLGYTETPYEYYNQPQWNQQVAAINSPNLTARIAEPTEVFKLIQDLMVDLAIDIHTDVVEKKIVMRFLINQIPTMSIDDGMIVGTPKAEFYPDKRVDLFYMYFGRKNPLEKMDEAKNYPATIVRPSSNPVALVMGNPAAIRRHFSRWVPSTLRSQTSITAAFIVGRYEMAPRGLKCEVKATMSPNIAQIVNVTTSVFEDEYGATPTIPMQVVSLSKAQGNYSIELEEFRAAAFEPGEFPIIVSLSEDVLNMGGFGTMRNLYDSIYPFAIPPGSNIRFEADVGVVYGSTGSFSVVMGDWPEIAADGVTVQIVGLFIAGRGGNGGSPGSSGQSGGSAFYTRVDVELIDCVVGGGGGGGGGRSSGGLDVVGGGGAGRVAGIGSVNGTLTDGGAGPAGAGSGGDLGQAGTSSSSGASGGAAGIAIDGDSYVTISGTTTVYGSSIN